jgi:5-methylcytosine-specific restriction endonuclease McrA
VSGAPLLEKACSKCGEVKPATTEFFDKHSGCRFGVHSQCQDCFKGAGYSANRIRERALANDAARDGQKICTVCAQRKPATFDFFFNDHRNGGLLAKCRECMKALRRQVYKREIVDKRPEPEAMPPGQRRCRKCLAIQPLERFFPAAECKDGRRPECRQCTMDAQRVVYLRNTPHCRRVRRAAYEPDDLRRCGSCHEWKPAIPDNFGPTKGVKVKFDSVCRPCLSAKYQATKHLQKASRRAAKANRNARLRGKSGFVSAAFIRKLEQGQRGRCWWCQKKSDRWHVDHRIPIKHGGEHTAGNLVLACPPCNLRKSAKMPWEMNSPRLL